MGKPLDFRMDLINKYIYIIFYLFIYIYLYIYRGFPQGSMELPWKIALLDGILMGWGQGCGAVEKDSCCPTCRVCHVGLVSRVGYINGLV